MRGSFLLLAESIARKGLRDSWTLFVILNREFDPDRNRIGTQDFVLAHGDGGSIPLDAAYARALVISTRQFGPTFSATTLPDAHHSRTRS
jgi:hypothetical protein